MYPEADQIRALIAAAQRIVIVQADNPDGDSMGSALALEHILGDMGKSTYLYCGVDIPSYLSYLPGWDRINKDLPSQFDLSIIVDTSADSLLEKLQETGQKAILKSKPIIVIDHHATEATITYATVLCNKPVVAAAEVLYELASQLQWPMSVGAKEMIATAIMADSLGLVTDATSARSIHIIAELVEGGVSLASLEHARRQLMRKSPEITHYKGELLQRVEYYADNRIAVASIPWQELEAYSPQYNPSMLVIEDMRMTIGTQVAVCFKIYKDGKVTGKIRCNQDAPVGGALAEHFGGGGHKFASGFKIQDGRPFNEVKSECIAYATQLLDNLKQGQTNEALQYPDA